MRPTCVSTMTLCLPTAQRCVHILVVGCLAEVFDSRGVALLSRVKWLANTHTHAFYILSSERRVLVRLDTMLQKKILKRRGFMNERHIYTSELDGNDKVRITLGATRLARSTGRSKTHPFSR